MSNNDYNDNMLDEVTGGKQHMYGKRAMKRYGKRYSEEVDKVKYKNPKQYKKDLDKASKKAGKRHRQEEKRYNRGGI